MKYIKMLSYAKKRILFVLLTTVLSIFINIIVLIVTAPPDANVSILDTISMPLGGGGVSKMPISFPIIPLFIFLILTIMSYEKSNFIITRMEKKELLWLRQLKLTTVIAVIYSLIIVGISYLMGGILLGDFTNRWGENKGYLFDMLSNQTSWINTREIFTTPVSLSLIIISLALGLVFIGIATLVLNVIFKEILSFFTVTSIVLFDSLLPNSSYILKNMYLAIENLIQPLSIVFEILTLVIGILFLYNVGKNIVLKKDFI